MWTMAIGIFIFDSGLPNKLPMDLFQKILINESLRNFIRCCPTQLALWFAKYIHLEASLEFSQAFKVKEFKNLKKQESNFSANEWFKVDNDR